MPAILVARKRIKIYPKDILILSIERDKYENICSGIRFYGSSANKFYIIHQHIHWYKAPAFQVLSISLACLRVASVIFVPPDIRASSSMRSSSRNLRITVRVLPALVFFSSR